MLDESSPESPGSQARLTELERRYAELETQHAALRAEHESLKTSERLRQADSWQSRAGFRRIFQDSPLGAALLDGDFRFIEANPQFERLLGYTQNELQQLRLCQVARVAADASTTTQAARLKTGEISVHSAEKCFLSKTNQELWGQVTVSAIRDPQNNFLCFLTTVSDITARKQAEAELSESEERYRNLFEAESDAIFLIDNETNCILEANSAAEALYGFSRAELLQKKNYELSAEPEETQRVTHGTPIICDNIVTIPLRYHRKADGTVFPIEITGRFFVRHGRNVHLAAIRDITARKQAEAEKVRMEEQYRQSLKMESIGRLAGGVAHDLNNMLTPILGYGTMLLNDLSTGDVRRHAVENIVHAGTRARDLVQQLLAFSRKQMLEFRSIDLNSELKVINNLLRRTVREDISIRFEPAAGSLLICGDLGQLEQVLMNLAINAQDAMPEGGTLTIATAAVELDALAAQELPETKPGSYAVLRISDTGTGMDSATLAQIFEPFFTTKARGHGTGLGLSTAYGAVKQHGGSIAVESAPGQGTTFSIYLPLSAQPSACVATEESEPSNAPGRETILLTEDDDMARELAETILSLQGYEVLSAASGQEALELLAQQSSEIDLLLTDVIMPDMNGNQLYNQIATRKPAIKVLYMSGYPANVIAPRGVMTDSLNFIQKPFMVNSLITKVREVLDA